MRDDLIGLLERGVAVLADGAIGTMLQSRGQTGGGAPEAWNVERPDVVRDLHADYARAGARILTTNTFGGTRARLAMHALDDRVHELNRAGAALAREAAAGTGAFVAGSVGPTGEMLAPLGTLEPEGARELFAEQVAALAEGGADLVIIETMSDLAEALAAVDGARAAAPDLPVAVTMTFDTHLHTMFGVSPTQAVAEIAARGVRLIGGNCGNGPAEIGKVIEQMAAARPEGVFLIAQSNAGLPHLEGDEFIYDATPDVMAAYAVRMRDLGADWIGACCGSSPEHVAAMRGALERAGTRLAVAAG
jgi:5-methyltetrahydrofolate--homocysteine methyltransferase